jgi:hypothetical protein
MLVDDSKLCTTHPDCWATHVDNWLDEDWKKLHDEASERRKQMPGVPHHQGSHNLSKFAKAYVSLHNFSNPAVLNCA